MAYETTRDASLTREKMVEASGFAPDSAALQTAAITRSA